MKLKQEQAEIWKDMLYGILNHMNHKKSINFKKNNHEVYTH